MGIENCKKIFICGISGAGKTTLAKNVAINFGHSPINMDEHFWLENWEQRPVEDFYDRTDKAIQTEKWVLEGAVGKVISRYAPQADIVIWLNFSRYFAIFRVLKRITMHYNKKTRAEMPDGCIERFDFNFIKWIWKYPTRNKKIREFFNENNIEFIEIKNKREFKKLLGGNRVIL